MSSLPIVRGSSAALYPFTMTLSFLTGLGTWQNGAQQRWVRGPGLVKFALPYSALTQSQKNTLKAAITSAKGRFGNTLELTLGSTTYTNLSLDSDEWSATEAVTTQYAGPMKLSQQIGQNLSPGSPGAPFPLLSNGAIGILPYVQKKRFQTAFQKVEAGPAYSYAEFAGGLTGYPTDGLMAWEFNAEHVSDADIATLQAHFIANWGRAFSFQYTDEDGVTYPETHYATDDLAVTYRGVNDSSIRISLEATAAASSLPSVVQSFAYSAENYPTAFAGNVTAGNLLAVILSVGITNSTYITDSLGSIWTRQFFQSAGLTDPIAVFTAFAPADGACLITFHGASSWVGICGLEIASCSQSQDGTPVYAGSSATSPGSLTTTQANSMVIVGLADTGDSTASSWTAPGGWGLTQQPGDSLISNYNAAGVAWKLQASPGVVNPTFTGSNIASNTQMMLALRA